MVNPAVTCEISTARCGTMSECRKSIFHSLLSSLKVGIFTISSMIVAANATHRNPVRQTPWLSCANAMLIKCHTCGPRYTWQGTTPSPHREATCQVAISILVSIEKLSRCWPASLTLSLSSLMTEAAKLQSWRCRGSPGRHAHKG